MTTSLPTEQRRDPRSDDRPTMRQGATQTSPRNYPGSCSQREPKNAKLSRVRSSNLIYEALFVAPWLQSWKGLITQWSPVDPPPKIGRLVLLRECYGSRPPSARTKLP